MGSPCTDRSKTSRLLLQLVNAEDVRDEIREAAELIRQGTMMAGGLDEARAMLSKATGAFGRGDLPNAQMLAEEAERIASTVISRYTRVAAELKSLRMGLAFYKGTKDVSGARGVADRVSEAVDAGDLSLAEDVLERGRLEIQFLKL